MKLKSVKLVYFSPTGTTKTIVQAIARGINQSAVEIIDITKTEARKEQLQTSEDELLVVGVPVYSGRVPAVATDWLCTVQASNTPAVCVVVYGNREYDDALLELKDTMVKGGCVPVACAAYIGEHSFSNSETPIAVARPDADDLSHAKLFGKTINARLLSLSSNYHISDIAVPGNYPYRPYKDPKTITDTFMLINDNCLHCGVCVEICPVDAIDLGSIVSTNMDKCILCCACVKGCPEKARDVKDGGLKKIAVRLTQTCQRRKEPEFFL